MKHRLNIPCLRIVFNRFPVEVFALMKLWPAGPILDAEQAQLGARRRLPKLIFDFIDGSTGQEVAERENRSALQEIKLQPRILVDVEALDFSTTFLQKTYQRPFGFAPMGMCNLTCPGADAIMSKLAAERKLPHCVSTASSTTLEQSHRDGDGHAWFQLYAGTDQQHTDEFIDRAKSAEYDTLVFTVDTPRLSRRNRDYRNGFQVPFRIGPKQFFDFATHPVWSISTLLNGPPKPMNYFTSSHKSTFKRGDSRGGADWHFLDRLRRRWKGRLIVKGVTNADDARRIQQCGVDAIYISNHGGRQLDSAAAAIHYLPNVRQAVGSDYPLIFDSGVRSADDIVRALALGADFVMLGRPILYALGAGGGDGLSSFLNHLEDDIKSVMAQIGVTRTDQINSSVLAELPWPNHTPQKSELRND